MRLDGEGWDAIELPRKPEKGVDSLDPAVSNNNPS